MSGDLQSLVCVECERTWTRPKQGGRPPRRCPLCVQAASSPPAEPTPAPAPAPTPAPARPTSTGVACRVCGVDDGEPRAQRDLHLDCAELATNKVKKRQAARRANRIEKAGTPIAHDELVTRLALERAGLVSAPRRDRGRPARTRVQEGEERDDEVDGLTADEVEHIEMITRGGGLATEGLE